MEISKIVEENYDQEDNYDTRREQVKLIAELTGKSAASITQILVRMKIYKGKPRANKAGEPLISKDELASKIGVIIGANENEVTSLISANKGLLRRLYKYVA